MVIRKDKVYKMMDRQDDLSKFNRLERESNFYSTFIYYYNLLIDKNIELFISSEAPHSPATLIIF